MLDDLDELRTFHRILARGSLSAAGRDLGVSLAVVSKRLASLERRTGQRLIHRTTRSLSPTDEGAALASHLDGVLEALKGAEERLQRGRDEPAGLLRISAPVALGRLHVAPVLAKLIETYPALDAELRLSDGMIDLMEARIDVAVRMGPARDSAMVMRKLAETCRVLAASPAYLDERGRPEDPNELMSHTTLRMTGWAAPWSLTNAVGVSVEVNPPSRLATDNGEVVHDWALRGLGIMLRSLVDITADLKRGRLERVLPHWQSKEAPIYALLPSAPHVPTKVRVFLASLTQSLQGES